MLGAWMVDGGGAMLENGIPQRIFSVAAAEKWLRNPTRSHLTDSVN